MKNLNMLIQSAPAEQDRWTWATVETASPLAIRLDGDIDPLPFVPDCLYASPSLGDRVWVQLSGRSVVVIGKHH